MHEIIGASLPPLASGDPKMDPHGLPSFALDDRRLVADCGRHNGATRLGKRRAGQ